MSDAIESGVSCDVSQGTFTVTYRGSGCYYLVLDGFRGTISTDGSVSKLKILLVGECEIGDVSVQRRQDRLDVIEMVSCVQDTDDGRSMGTSKAGAISATNVLMSGTCIEFGSIDCDVLAMRSSQAYGTGAQAAVTASNHIWVVDSILEVASDSTAISSPYILIDNGSLNVSGAPAIECEGVSLEHASLESATFDGYVCSAAVIDPLTGNPEAFMWHWDPETKTVTSRLVRSGCSPMRPATAYDWFKESTGYTNVDLHRRVDQEGAFQSPEVAPRRYDLGIYSLNSFRTIETSYRVDGSNDTELP